MKKNWRGEAQILLSRKQISSYSYPREVSVYVFSRTPWSGENAYALMCSHGNNSAVIHLYSFHITGAGHRYVNGLNQTSWKDNCWGHIGLNYALHLHEKLVRSFDKALVEITRCRFKRFLTKSCKTLPKGELSGQFNCFSSLCVFFFFLCLFGVAVVKSHLILS